MKNIFLTTNFIIFFFTIASSQTEENDSITESNFDEISIIDKYGAYYLKKGDGYALQATFKGSYGPKKDIFMRFIKDFPELYSLALNNLNVYRDAYGIGLIHCYNDYQRSGRTKELNQSYFEQFGLISLKEYRNGPSKEKLKNPEQIKGIVNHIVVVTDNYTNHMKTSSTRGEYHRLKFYYGEHYYKGGFALKNLKKAIGQDEEANKYIKQYKRRYFARATIIGIGLIQAGLAVTWWVNEKAPFGMSTPVGIAVLAPGAIFLNWNNLFPQKYKTRLINKTIDTYNGNLLL